MAFSLSSSNPLLSMFCVLGADPGTISQMAASMGAQAPPAPMMKSPEEAAAAAQHHQHHQQQQHPIIAIDQDMHRASELHSPYMMAMSSGLGGGGMAGGGGGLGGSKGRKPRFTKEQHAAIMESVERNFKEHPSRYTELVIKEMKDQYPHLEITSACVRKMKFRWVPA